MTPLEHLREAERLLAVAGTSTLGSSVHASTVATAQVHATLAMAAQTLPRQVAS